MRREYIKPVAKKVVFNYEKVVAQSGQTCIWIRTDNYAGCTTTREPDKTTMLASLVPECGWWVERT